MRAAAAGEGAAAASLAALAAAEQGCTRCPLYRDASQAVPGEGPADARLSAREGSE